eukprot:gene14380-16968_t
MRSMRLFYQDAPDRLRLETVHVFLASEVVQITLIYTDSPPSSAVQIVVLINSVDVNTTLQFTCQANTPAGTCQSQIPLAVSLLKEGDNTIQLLEITGSMNASDVSLVPALSTPMSVKVLDVKVLNFLEINDGTKKLAFYSFGQTHCQATIVFQATDNYYGVKDALMIAGTPQNEDVAGNQVVHTFSPPLVCLSSSTDSSLFTNVLSHNSVQLPSDPLAYFALSLSSASVLYPYNTVSSQDGFSSPLKRLISGASSNLVVVEKLATSQDIVLSLGTAQSSLITSPSLPSTDTSTATISQVTLNQWKPATVFTSTMTVLLQFTVTSPQDISLVLVKSDGKTIAFDNNILPRVSNGIYSNTLNIAPQTKDTPTFTLTYYTSSASHDVSITSNIVRPATTYGALIDQMLLTQPTANKLLVGFKLEQDSRLSKRQYSFDGFISQSQTIELPYGSVGGSLDKPMIKVATRYPTSISQKLSVDVNVGDAGGSTSSVDIIGNDSLVIDNTPPNILSMYLDYVGKTIKLHVYDLSGVSSCRIESAYQPPMPITMANATKISLDQRDVQFTANIARLLDPLFCDSSIKLSCFDRLLNRVEFTTGEYGFQNTTFPALQCPSFTGSIPVGIRVRNINLSTLSVTLTYTTTAPNPPTSVIAVFVSGNKTITVDLAATPSSSPLLTATGQITLPPTHQSGAYNISLIFQTNNINQTITNSQLSNLLNRISSDRLFSSATVFIGSPNIASQPPVFTSATIASGIVTVVVADPSAIDSISITYRTSLDPKPITITSASITSASTAIDLGFMSRECGEFYIYAHPSKICDKSSNCLVLNYADYPLDQKVSLSLTAPSISISSFSYTPNTIITNTDYERDRNITFTATILSGLGFSTPPTVYIEDAYLWLDRIALVLKNTTALSTNEATFKGSIVIPKGFGLSGATLSIYGIADACGNQYGLDSISLAKTLTIQQGCSNNCNGRGTCVPETGRCTCQPEYAGKACEMPSGCPGDCNDNGICLSAGYCSCTSRWYGPGCDIYSRFYPPYNITFEPDRPWCEYSINGTYNTTTPEISNNVDQKFSFIVKFYSVQEVSVTGELIRETLLDGMAVQGLASDFNMSKTTDDGAQYLASMKVTNKTIDVKWVNETISMPRASVKYALSISNYTFANSLNTMIVTWNVSRSSVGSRCTVNETRPATLGGDGLATDGFNFIEWPFFSYTLYARFPDKGIADGRAFTIQNYVVRNDSDTMLLGMRVPHFIDNMIIDPDFSVLLNRITEEQSIFTSCSGKVTPKGEVVRKKTKLSLAAAIAVPVVLATVVAIGIAIALRKLQHRIWFRRITISDRIVLKNRVTSIHARN